ncbi:MAG: glycoside hydrolase family 31 protein [Leptolyngbya sp. Prado105]|jgi:alpha-glucosidase|nr:glycoside hydrolase family 31 protein [Leptolyngbya sp. Prado105]
MRFLKQLSLTARFLLKSLFYVQYVPQALFYAYQRDRAERYFSSQSTSEPLLVPGKLLNMTRTDRGVQIDFEQAELSIEFLAPDLVRINWFPGLAPISYAIVDQDWDRVDVTVKQDDHGYTIASHALSIIVQSDGYIRFLDSTGQTLREELPPQRQSERWVHQAKLQPEEHIYGLGERAASLNLRSSKTYQMWNRDPAGHSPGVDPLYICIPSYLGLHEQGSYLIFYENSFLAQFSFDEVATADFEGGSLRYYLSVGNPSQLIERYTQLTGRAPLPARWALGYHQSRWGYYTEKIIRQEIEAFQAHQIPLSAIHFDIDCQVGHRPFTIDPDRFPKLNDFTQELAKSGIHCIAINNPGVKMSRESNLFLEGQILNAFCTYPDGTLVTAPVWAGRKAFPDFTNPRVRSWWSRQYAYLLDVGISGFWHDMNEPATFASWGDPSLPKVAQHHMEGRGGDHREAHNLYGLLEARAAYESLREYQPQQRPFIVSRSGWAGLQRYAWTWTGDVSSTWESLRQTISTVLGLGLSGIPYTGPDIGGFQGNPSAELYLRWFQMATFLPFYRTHCAISDLPRAPWTYGEPYLSIIRSFVELRHQLMPYLYTLAWETTQKGYPIVRPLFWLDWQNASLWDVDDAFCLGNQLLIAPIVEAGVKARSLYLPKGSWYSFWNDTLSEGEQSIEVEASLEELPVFVKAGTVLPMEKEGQLILHLYPLATGESESYMYSDAGDGYEAGRVDRFHLSRTATDIEVSWNHDGTAQLFYATVQLQLHGITATQAWIDEQAVVVQGQQLDCQQFQRARFQIALP